MSGYRLVERGKRTLYFEDLYCQECETLERDVTFSTNEWPICCGEKMNIAVVTPRRTDCYGTPRYSDASGKWHSSRRDLVNHMRSLGYDEAGDAVGGARKTLEIKDSSFSYAGQASRRSSGERKRERKVRRQLQHTGRLPA